MFFDKGGGVVQLPVRSSYRLGAARRGLRGLDWSCEFRVLPLNVSG